MTLLYCMFFFFVYNEDRWIRKHCSIIFISSISAGDLDKKIPNWEVTSKWLKLAYIYVLWNRGVDGRIKENDKHVPFMQWIEDDAIFGSEQWVSIMLLMWCHVSLTCRPLPMPSLNSLPHTTHPPQFWLLFLLCH